MKAPATAEPADGVVDRPASLRSMISRGDKFERAGKVWTFESVVGDLWIFRCGDEVLQVPRASDGLLAHPVERDVARMIRTDELRLMSRPLRDAARRRARAREATRAEVLARDPVAELRMQVCLWVDRVNPKRDDENLMSAFRSEFDEEATRAAFGVWPSAATIRNWANRRGTPGDRRWADMEATPGQGERRRRVVGLRAELAVWHATRTFSKKGARMTPAGAYRALVRDTNRLNRGDPLKMDRYEPGRSVPEDLVTPLNRSGFYDMCRQLETNRNERHRTSDAFVRSRRRGGGVSIEPVRFMSHVQMDETEVSAFFFIDERRRVPLGTAVSTIAVCCYSGAIVGWDLGWEAGSTSSWMRTVLHMASLKTVPEEFRAEFPDLEYMAGIASLMIYDNARHYAGIAVQDAGGDVIQDVMLAGEGAATHKALVERTHHSLFELVIRKMPSRKLAVQVAREWNVDMSAKTACDLATFRKHWANAIALHNVLPGSDGRSPIQKMREQRARFGIPLPSDVQAFARAIANETFSRIFDKSGVTIFRLRYVSSRPGEKLLDDFVAASKDRRRTKNPSFDAKIKVYDHDLSRVAIFNPLTGAYEDLVCARPRYAAGLTRRLHAIVRAVVGKKALEEVTEETLLEIRGRVEDAIENDFPDALARENSVHGTILSDPRTLAIAADRAVPRFVPPSPTGQEAVKRDLGMQTRKDGNRLAPAGRRTPPDEDPMDTPGPEAARTPDGTRAAARSTPSLPSAASIYGGREDLL